MAVALTVSVDDATLGALDRLAKTTDRPRDWLVAQAIEDYVAQNARAVARIEAGLAAAEAGDFASPEEEARVRAKFAATE